MNVNITNLDPIEAYFDKYELPKWGFSKEKKETLGNYKWEKVDSWKSQVRLK